MLVSILWDICSPCQSQYGLTHALEKKQVVWNRCEAKITSKIDDLGLWHSSPALWDQGFEVVKMSILGSDFYSPHPQLCFPLLRFFFDESICLLDLRFAFPSSCVYWFYLYFLFSFGPFSPATWIISAALGLISCFQTSLSQMPFCLASEWNLRNARLSCWVSSENPP